MKRPSFLRRGKREASANAPLPFDEWANMFGYGGLLYPLLNQSLQADRESIEANFCGFAQGALKSSGVVFAAIDVRMSLFSDIRFAYRRFDNGRAGPLFTDASLGPLEKPWPNGTTGDLLARAELDVSLAGNCYIVREGPYLKRLRPDWMEIVLGSEQDPEYAGEAIDAEVIGYRYYPGGKGYSGRDPIGLLPSQVAHYAPKPDPEARFRGMSWLTPIVREILADKATTSHKLKYFENGAPQPLDAKVLTTCGWTRMGEIEVGDSVVGRDGRGHEVLAVYPQGERDIYRVTFSDGAATECTEDHIWRVETAYDRKRGQARTMTLSEIMADGVAYPCDVPKWSVPFVEPVEFEQAEDLPVDPYLLGLVLGDGNFSGNGKGSGGVSLAVAAEDADELETLIAPLLPAENTISRSDRGGWSTFYFRSLGGPRPNPLTVAVRELDLFGLVGRDKFIPEAYLRAPIGDRIALLQGLVDSDGHVDARQGSSVSITTTSINLATQIVDLVGSLGGSSSWRRDASRATMDVAIRRLPDWIVPCRLGRKVERYLPVQRVGRRRFITAVEYVGRKPAQCISVDSDEHLYVTDDYIVTHNTPNLIVKFDVQDPEKFRKWRDLFVEGHEGNANAFKTLFIAAGTDATPVGSNLKDIDFTRVQGGGELRIASAAGVPAGVLGLAKSLEQSAYNNEAKGVDQRRLSDITMRTLWRNFCGSIEHLLDHPSDGRELWFDTRETAFLRDDIKDAAEARHLDAQTINQLVMAGYDPDVIIDAVEAGDISLLRGSHTGLTSVQMQPAGDGQQANGQQADS